MGRTILNSSHLGSASRWVSRRTEHGSTAWASSSALRQPQDGAAENSDSDVRARVTDIGSRFHKKAAAVEPEDAGMTGGTRSLVRRLMGLNVMAVRKTTAMIVKPVARAAAAAADRTQVA